MYSRNEVKSIPYPQTKPVVFEYDGQKKELCKVQSEIEWEEGIRVNVKSICPLDSRVSWNRMGRRRNQKAIGNKPWDWAGVARFDTYKQRILP